MNRLRLLLAVLATATLVAACNQQAATSTDRVVATVDGQPVSRNTFEHYATGVTGKPFGEITPPERIDLLDALVRAQVVAAEARRSGIADRPEVTAALQIQQLTILQRAAAEDLLQDRQPSEDELRAEYDLRATTMDKTEYRLSHIAVDSAEAASELIAQLDKGGDFAALARQHSLDNNTRTQGGDLLWSTPSGMPPTFAVAVREMKNGEHSKTPLRTDVAWHVIRLTDSRETTVPPFEDVREQLVQAVQQKQFDAWVDGLVGKAAITKTP